MTDGFIAIRLILRYGTLGAVVTALLVSLCALMFLWSTMGWFSIGVALAVGGLALLIAKSYVEIVSIVFQMVH